MSTQPKKLKFKPGKLFLSKKKKKAKIQDDESAELDPETIRKMEEDKIIKLDEEIADEVTETEAKFMKYHNNYIKRQVEKKASVSIQEEISEFNKHLKALPMHNENEGD